MTSTGPEDPMERIRAVFDQPYPSLPIPPGTWERIETESRRRRRSGRLRTVASVAASLLVVGAGVGLLWPRSPGPVQPGGPGPSTSSAAPTTPSPAPSTSSSPPSSPTVASEPTGAAADGLPRGGPVPKGFVPVSLSGVTGTAGGRYLYLLGDAPGCGNPVCTSMVRSQDGGRSWVGIPAPEAETGGDNPDAVREVRFATAKDGYAFGPTLFETHDGGQTWTRRPLSSQVLDLAVLGDRIWVVLATCEGAPCTSPRLMSAPASGGPLTAEDGVRLPAPVSLARLADGGGTLSLMVGTEQGTAVWVLQKDSPWREADPRPCDAVVNVASQVATVTPAADGSGLLAAGCLGTGGDGATLAAVVTSSNAGRTWQQAGTPVEVPNSNLRLAVSDAEHLLLLANPIDGSTSFELSSADRGQSWAPPVGDVPPDGFRWIGAGGGGLVYGLRGADGLLYTSTDGGGRFRSAPVE